MQENKMGVMPVNRLLISMALPMVISMLVQALYNIVDSIFVARLSEDALTAVSMAFPMQNLMISVAVGLGVGINAFLSRSLGQKDFVMVNKTAVNGIFLEAVGYILFLIISFTAVRPFYMMQAGEGEITEMGNTSRKMIFEARKVVKSRPDISASAADVLAEPVVVCRAHGTCVTPKDCQRKKIEK